MQIQWYTKSIADVFEEVESGQQGLSEQEAISRLGEYGQNKLPEAKPDGLFVIFLRQFKSSLIYILLFAGVIVFAMGEIADGLIILAVLIFNAIVGAAQEGKAQNTLLALKKYTETRTTVLRDSQEVIVTDKNIVPGDVIILQEGEKVPADARIILSNNLKTDESALSGESVPAHKISETIDREYLPVAEQKNIVFKGTNILSGSGRAVVVATGINTAIGKIAKEIALIDTEIPLKKNIRYLSRAIIIIVVFLNVILFTEGLISGKGAKEMFTTLVSLSISVIPEGLPIVMTLILATGVWRMSKRNALVKRLQAVGALGQAEIIAVDKTGTITKNEMVVQKVFVDNRFFDIGGTGYEPKGHIKADDKLVDPLNHPELIFAVKNAALCADARVVFLEKEGRWTVGGDPTEASLLVLAQKIGFHKNILEQESPSVAEFPFDYRLRHRASVRKVNSKDFLIVIGAPENILEISKKIWRNGENCSFLKEEKEKLKNIFEEMSGEGLRVVAMGINNSPPKNI
ncbi:MAG: HAD-IC family P-type ATPase, partial [bacterium]